MCIRAVAIQPACARSSVTHSGDSTVFAVAVFCATICDRLNQHVVGVWTTRSQKRKQVEPVATLVEIKVGDKNFITLAGCASDVHFRGGYGGVGASYFFGGLRISSGLALIGAVVLVGVVALLAVRRIPWLRRLEAG